MAAQPMYRRGLAGAVLVLAALAPGCASRQHASARAQPTDRVSMGYGQQSRKDVTSAVSSVQTDPRRDNAVQIEQLILGRVSGVEVLRLGDGRVSLRIRGASSFMASSEPLYVIDGVKVHADTFTDAMSGINPADVVRIDVLKDAGATAIYGTEGGNGVVMITTRHGR